MKFRKRSIPTRPIFRRSRRLRGSGRARARCTRAPSHRGDAGTRERAALRSRSRSPWPHSFPHSNAKIAAFSSPRFARRRCRSVPLRLRRYRQCHRRFRVRDRGNLLASKSRSFSPPPSASSTSFIAAFCAFMAFDLVFHAFEIFRTRSSHAFGAEFSPPPLARFGARSDGSLCEALISSSFPAPFA